MLVENFVSPCRDGLYFRHAIKALILNRKLQALDFSQLPDTQDVLSWMRSNLALAKDHPPNLQLIWSARLLGLNNIKAVDLNSIYIDWLCEAGLMGPPLRFDAQGRSFYVGKDVFCGVSNVQLMAQDRPKPAHLKYEHSHHVKTQKACFMFSSAHHYECPIIAMDYGYMRMAVADSYNAHVPDTKIVRAATAAENMAHFTDVREAMAILAKADIRIRDWVLEGIHTIVGVIAANNYDFSQSTAKFRGSSIISINRHPVDIAEMLVHEASHQHFFLLQDICRLVEPGTPETLYSPITDMQRPIEKVLLGYHAAANILNFYNRYGPLDDTAPVRTRWDAMKAMCAVFAAELDQASSLTQEGIGVRDGLKTLAA